MSNILPHDREDERGSGRLDSSTNPNLKHWTEVKQFCPNFPLHPKMITPSGLIQQDYKHYYNGIRNSEYEIVDVLLDESFVQQFIFKEVAIALSFKLTPEGRKAFLALCARAWDSGIKLQKSQAKKAKKITTLSKAKQEQAHGNQN